MAGLHNGIVRSPSSLFNDINALDHEAM